MINEIRINEIREILKDGYGASLEIVDREKITDIGLYNHWPILNAQSSLTVIREEKGRLILKEKSGGIPLTLVKDDLMFFKLTGIVPTLYRVIDVALDAVKNGVAVVTHLKTDEIVIESVDYNDESPMEVFKDDSLEKFQDAIEWIGSLYTETFVINDVSDVLNCKRGARLVFSNGVDSEFLESYFGGLRAEILFLDSGKCCNVPIELLKGATVTQKRGACYE